MRGCAARAFVLLEKIVIFARVVHVLFTNMKVELICFSFFTSQETNIGRKATVKFDSSD